MKPILVTSYVDPDLDGVASMIAYAEYLRTTGTDAVAGIIGKPQIEAEYLLRRFGIPSPEILSSADGYRRVILVDASDRNNLEGTVDAESVIEIIDHREVHEADAFSNARVQIERVGAASTLVAEKFMHNDREPSKDAATLLYGGIVSNTLNFKADVTTDRDRAAATWLNRIAELPEDFAREMFLAKSDISGKQLGQRMRDDFKWLVLGGHRIGIAEIELLGARALLSERIGEITRILDQIKVERKMDYIFQSTVELEDPRSFLVTGDAETQELLQRVFQIQFTNGVAELPQVLMRKQMVPLLKKALE